MSLNKNSHTLIYTSPDKYYRIIEVQDSTSGPDDLLGDTYKPEFNPDILPKSLEKQKQDMLLKIEREGVFGYVLEKWDPMPDQGWVHVDSCFGFVGTYEKEKHYIVEEFKHTIFQNYPERGLSHD